MKDRSLRINGIKEKVELTFHMEGPRFEYRRLTMEGETLDAFKEAPDRLNAS